MSQYLTSTHIAGCFVAEERSLENPQLSLSDPATWNSVFGTEATDSGVRVTHDTVYNCPPFWQAVTMIAGDLAGMPFNLYNWLPKISDNARQIDEANPLQDTIRHQWNDEVTAYEGWENLFVHALTYKGGFALIERDGEGNPVELYNLLPDRTGPERLKTGELIYVSEINGKLYPFLPGDIIHIRNISARDSMNGLDLTNSARHSIGLALATQKFASKFFKGGGRIGGVLEVPVGTPKVNLDKIEEGFRKTYEGADNPFKTVILRDGAKFHAAQQSPQDSQLVEATEEEARNVARWFNMAPSRLGVAGSTSYAEKSEDNQNYLDSTLQRWMNRNISQCNVKLLTEKQRRKQFFDYETCGLLRMNPLKQAQKHQLQIASRIINPNEARDELNLLPYDGGDEFVNPNTLKSGSPQDGAKPAASGDAPTESTKPARSVEYMRALYDLTKKARHKSDSVMGFKAWLRGSLSADRAEYMARTGENEAEIFDIVHQSLKKATENVKKEQFSAAVDAACLELEKNHGT